MAELDARVVVFRGKAPEAKSENCMDDDTGAGEGDCVGSVAMY